MAARRESKSDGVVISEALRDTLISPNESDSNLEPANIVDAIVKAARIEAGQLARVADALARLATAVERIAEKG